MNEGPRMIAIKEIREETHKHKTFFLDTVIKAIPGQFLMAWLPGLDEKPFSLSHTGRETAITVEKKGIFTKSLFGLKPGDSIGIRGPYGNGFSLDHKGTACIVGGGCGIAPLAPLIEKLEDSTVIIGAKTRDDLLFSERFPQAIFTTDDGSFGRKGFTTQSLEDVIREKRPETIYTCGPEAMMMHVLEICKRKGIHLQASLERYMKCGIGICGNCCIGESRVCKDGPVFTGEQLLKMEEFGRFARLKTGKKVSLKEYAEWRSEK